MARILDRLAHAISGWNAFDSPKPEETRFDSFAPGGRVSYGRKPDVVRSRNGNDKAFLGKIINRIAIDASGIEIRHVDIDKNGNFLSVRKSGLNDCLLVEANIDQGARAFRQDLVETLCDKGTIAVVPIDTDVDPEDTQSYDIKSLRIGEIKNWMPKDVRVECYNDSTGEFGELTFAKRNVAIVENPLYKVMNEPNSTLKRLIRKLNLLDHVDEQASSGKLDIIIQLPYVIKTEARKQQADQRRAELERQMSEGKYGVAYMDGSERITQLNRPAENNLVMQIADLKAELYAELGLTKSVFDGTATEEEMLNYHNRTIEPILDAIAEAMKRSFLTKTGRSQGQSVEYFRNPFKLAPISQIAELADKLTRNEVLTGNEFRAIIGYQPHDDPNANKLINKNLPQPPPVTEVVEEKVSVPVAEEESTTITEPTEERSDPSK